MLVRLYPKNVFLDAFTQNQIIVLFVKGDIAGKNQNRPHQKL